jgi:large subunit ribosomal protein L17
MRSLVRGLFISYSIKTTLVKAKQAGRLAEKVISYAKSAALKDIRAIDAILQDKALTRKVVSLVAPLSKDRIGGYTRIIRVGFRRGDGAQTAVLELTDMPEKTKKGKRPKAQKAKAVTPELPAQSAVLDEANEAAGRKDTKSKLRDKDESAPKPDRQDKNPVTERKLKPGKGMEKKRRPYADKGIIGKFKKFFDK